MILPRQTRHYKAYKEETPQISLSLYIYYIYIIYLHSLIPPKWVPFNDHCFAEPWFFFLRPDFCWCRLLISFEWRMPRKPSSYLKESCSAPRKEGIPGSLNFHSEKTDSFGLETIEDLQKSNMHEETKTSWGGCSCWKQIIWDMRIYPKEWHTTGPLGAFFPYEIYKWSNFILRYRIQPVCDIVS